MHRLSQLFVVAIMFATAMPAFGQVFIGGRGNPANATATQKKRFERELATKIGDMKRACKLSEVQVKKLQLAAKGAVVSGMEKFKAQQKKMRNQMRAIGLNAPGVQIEEVEEDDVDEDAAAADEDAADAELAVAGDFAVAFNALNVPAGGRRILAANEARWKKAVASVLTSEQKAAYDKALKQREAFVRKAAVNSFVARADLKLLLSPEQRTKLAVIVDEKFGKQLASQVNGPNQAFFFVTRAGANGKPPISHEQLKPVLSEAQLGEWKTSFEPELARMLPMAVNGAGAGFQNIIINAIEAPVFPAPAIRIEGGAGDGDK